MSANWTEQAERSNPLMLRILAWIARSLGRGIARLILWPTVFYFYCSGRQARQASCAFLTRVQGHPPQRRQILRHFHYFAACTLDRIFLFLNYFPRFNIQIHGADAVHELAREGRGALLLVSHLGSFEVMRAAAANADVPELKIRFLMNRQHGAMMTRVLESLNPGFAEAIIDTSVGDVDLVLRLRAALENGEMIGVMADRLHQAGERALAVDVLGERARLPASPWLLAGMLKVPVLLCFGLYRGGRDYEIHFESLGESVQLPRGQRMEAAQLYAQRYADRLSHHARQAPYNWFNFYDFWA